VIKIRSEAQKQADLKYRESARGKELQKQYKQSEIGKQKNKEAIKKYSQTEKGKEARRRAVQAFREKEALKNQELFDLIKIQRFKYFDLKRLVEEENYTPLMLADSLKFFQYNGANTLKVAKMLMEDFKKEDKANV
jgi:hypothetical protein